MNRMLFLISLMGLTAALSYARAGNSPYMPVGPQSTTQGQPRMILVQNDKPATPQVPAKIDQPQQQPNNVTSDAFSQVAPSGTELPGGYNPGMLGDSLIYNVNARLSSGSSSLYVPYPWFGAFKITDNESPRPQDRVYLNYNSFARVANEINGPGAPNFHVNRETFGIEKAFLDGAVSFGVRLPLIQLNGADINQSKYGDTTFIGKVALYDDCKTGNLISAGLAVTTPTGPDVTFSDGSSHNPTLIQPFVGGILAADDLYFQGFSSFVFPTDSVFATVWFLDVGVGYVFRNSDRDGLITGIAPTIEGHWTVPTGRTGSRGESSVPDLFVATGGVHVLAGRNSDLTIGMALPMTGPRPYATEWIIQLNVGF
ncbi:MAG: hypothetical protein K2R98_23385 [Gemmataceae bacterium]|nr:hypothetical protein [Gemmataceae bacterium]